MYQDQDKKEKKEVKLGSSFIMKRAVRRKKKAVQCVSE